MSWRGPALDPDQADLAALIDGLATGSADAPADDDDVAGRIAQLAELGLWTLGTAEEVGGGGAAPELSLLAWERMGRAWPALGWASVQTHAAIDLLGAGQEHSDLVARLHTGTAAVAIVEATSPRTRLSWDGQHLTGSVDRVDAAAAAPYLLVLGGRGRALLVDASAVASTPLTRSG